MLFFLAPALSMKVPPPNRYEVPQAPGVQQPLPASPRKLSDIPGVAITYYDAVGQTIPQLHDWLEKHGPHDPQTNKATPVSSHWSIGSAVKFTKTGGQCVLTSVSLKFDASVQLPRLKPDKERGAPVIASWNVYVAALEDRQARRLGFVHDRLSEVERAIMRSDCNHWQKAADAAITRLRQEQDQAFKADPAKLPKLQ